LRNVETVQVSSTYHTRSSRKIVIFYVIRSNQEPLKFFHSIYCSLNPFCYLIATLLSEIFVDDTIYQRLLICQISNIRTRSNQIRIMLMYLNVKYINFYQ